MTTTTTILDFEDLNLKSLYEILALRQEVFIVEQNCPFLDADNKDFDSKHLMIRNIEGLLMAYTRLLPKGLAYKEYASIGRVVTSPKARGGGLGKHLMQESITACRDLYGSGKIKIGAQLYLKKFYESFGFYQVEEPYDEDGIMHISMFLD